MTLQEGLGLGFQSMYDPDYEPRNAREKWLFRIVYWGTALVVALLLWEYVKAR